MLKSALLLLVGFLVGVIVTWRFITFGDPDLTVSSGDLDTAAPQHHQQSNRYQTTQKTLQQIPSTDEPAEMFNVQQIITQLIQNQKIAPAITLLEDVDLDRDENAIIKQRLFQNLNHLRRSESWGLLNDWLTQLMAVGFNDSYLYLLQSAMFVNSQQYGAALDALHIAVQNAPTLKAEGEINRQVDELITRLTSDYLLGKATLSDQEMLALLERAREKRPDHPHISINLAKVYASQGRLRVAIDTLALLPYGSDYDVSIDTLKTQLSEQLSQQTLIKTGIPLVRVGSQYIVEVVINGGITLNLLLDTGASFTALSAEAIERVGAETGGIYFQNKVAWVNTANGRIQSRVYTADTLAVEGFVLPNARILEASFDTRSRVDGLLGMDFLSHFQFKLDYDHDMLYLTPPSE